MATAQARASLHGRPSFWKIGDWPLFPKLWVSAVLIVVLSLIISGYDSVTSSRQALLVQGALNVKAASSHTSNAIDAYLLTNRNAIAAASALPDTIAYASNSSDNATRARALSTLKKVKTEFDYESIVIVDPRGTIILDTADESVNTNVSYAPYFREAMNGIVGYISDPSISVVTNRSAVHFSAPIFDPASVILGVVVSRESLDKISAIVAKDWNVAGPGTFGVLLDKNGIRIANGHGAATTDQAKSLLFSAVAPVPVTIAKQLAVERRFGNATSEAVPVIPLPEVAAAIADPQIKTFESSADLSAARHFGSISTLAVKPWSYVILAPLPIFTRPADDLAAHYVVILVVVAALVSIGVFFVARAITQPITYLTSVADRISLGELEIKIEMERKDEIGKLAQAFERMRLGTQVAIERLRARRG